MGNMGLAIRRELAACNGGPGLTDVELAERLGASPAVMRTELAALVFSKAGGVTCRADSRHGPGRYVLGDSAALRRVSG
jgi:hypothetical protein